MKCRSVLLLALFLTANAMTFTSLLWSQQRLPGCEAMPEVRNALEQLQNRDFERMKFSERMAHRRTIYGELIAKYPREAEPYRRLIFDVHWMYEEGRSTEYPALQERARRQATDNHNDALALYIAGLSLFKTDTSESFRLLEAAKVKGLQFPWPALELAFQYSTGGRMDKQKSSENLATFFAMCPASTDSSAQWLLANNADLQPRVAKALRARLEKETDPGRLEDYTTLWKLEFLAHPPQEHDALRKQITADLNRLESLSPKADSEWQAFLIHGYRQDGASSEAIKQKEDRLLRDYPHSKEAYLILSERWHKANKEPDDGKDVVAWAKYREAYTQALRGWIRDFPDLPYLAHALWFNAVADDDSVSEKEGIAAVDEYLRNRSEYRRPNEYIPDRWIQLNAAEFLLKHKWKPSRALDLLEQAKAATDRARALESQNDNLSIDEQNEQDEWQRASDLQFAGAILKATQLAGRPDRVSEIKQFVEGPPPTQEKLQSDYWWNRARLAVLEGHKQDALAYFQLALHTRLEAPQYSRGKLRDDLTEEAQAVWKETGGTPAAWAVWSKPLAPKPSAQGTWEKPKKALPSFELSDLSGRMWRLKDLAGKATLITVWATWCVPCNAELPKFQKLYEQLGARSDVQLLTFDIDEDLGLVEPYLKGKGYTFPVIPAYALVNNLLDSNTVIPQTWVVDPKGHWLWTQIGYGEEDNWAQVMTEKLDSAKTSN